MANVESEFNPWVTMSICSLGPSTLNKKESKVYATKNTNDISDISGAAPKVTRVWNKPAYNQSDVPGSTSKALSHSRNTQDNTLYIDDIDGTRHAVKDRMMRTTRRVNPLEPQYPMPSFEPDYIPPTKFIKDPQTHEDIDGSCIKPAKVFAVRDTMKVNDIHGAQTGWRRTIDKSGVYDSMTNEGIDGKRRIQDTNRRTDPCNPIYHINGMEYRDDKYSKPPPAKSQIMDSHLLLTKDITGAVPGALSTFPRREYRNTNYIDDIEGAQADTTKHSIHTNRQTNPLTPYYQSLDPDEYLAPVVAPLLPADMIKIPTIPRVSNSNSNGGNSHSKASVGHGGESPAQNNNRRPSGSLQLDFSKGLNNTTGGITTNRSGGMAAEGRSSGRQYGTDSPVTGSNFVSPIPTGRSQSNKAASSLLMGSSMSNSKRAMTERQDDINAVRSLPN